MRHNRPQAGAQKSWSVDRLNWDKLLGDIHDDRQNQHSN